MSAYLLASTLRKRVLGNSLLLWYRRLVGPMVLPGARMMTEEQVMQFHEGLRSWESNSCVFLFTPNPVFLLSMCYVLVASFSCRYYWLP